MYQATELTFRLFIDAMFMIVVLGLGRAVLGKLASIDKSLADQTVKLAVVFETLKQHGIILKEHAIILKEHERAINQREL